MELIWYGTASLILREQGTVIAFDPFGKLPIGGFSKKAQHVRRGEKQAGAKAPGGKEDIEKAQRVRRRGKTIGAGAPGNAEVLKKAQHILHEEEYRKATDVFVTHGHFDHIYHIPQIYRDQKVRIYCTEVPMRTLEKHGIPDMEIIKIAPGWSGEVGPFRIAAYQGRHCKFDLPMVFDILCRPSAWRHFFYSIHLAAMSLEYPENREILFYEVSVKPPRTGMAEKIPEERAEAGSKGISRKRAEAGSKGISRKRAEAGSKGISRKRAEAESKEIAEEKSGYFSKRTSEDEEEKERGPKMDFRIQIMGSMNLDPDVTYPTGADVLILPLQGRSDQDEYAVQFVERLQPKQVLLDHYDDAFPPISQDVDVSGFVKNVEERLHIPCRAMKEGEVLSP